MASKKDIVNFALSHIGHTPIKDSDSTSPAAIQGDLWLEQSKKELLIAYPWTFATKRTRLREKELDIFEARAFLDDWIFAYQVPEEVLFMQYMVDPSTVNQVYQVTSTPFTIERNPSNNPGESTRLILCNIAEAVGVYTVNIDDFSMLPAHFIQPLSVLLASHIVYPLTADNKLRNDLFNLYNNTLISYTAQDANQVKSKLPQESETIRVRESDYFNYGTIY